MSEHIEQRVGEKGAKSRSWIAAILGFSALMVVIGVAVSVRSVLLEKERAARIAESQEEKLRVLEVRIVAQQAKVEEKRKVLDAVIRSSGYPYFSEENSAPSVPCNGREVVESLEGEPLYYYFAGLSGEGNQVAKLYPEYLQARVDIEKLEEAGRKSEILQTKRDEFKQLKEDIEKAVAEMKERVFPLENDLSKQLASMENLGVEEERELVREATSRHELINAGRAFDAEIDVLQSLVQERSSQSKTDEESVEHSKPERASNTVTVSGGVVTPGPYPISPGMTMQDAVNQAGGLSAHGTIRRVVVFREGKRYELNLTLERHQKERVYPDDVVEVDLVQSWEGIE